MISRDDERAWLQCAHHELLLQREWQEYADACLTHDRDEPALMHATQLAHDPASGSLYRKK